MAALDLLLDLDVRLGTVSGYVAMVARDGHVVHATTAGYADIESGRPMQLDTRFRIASMTKPVTATAAVLLIEEGRLGLDDRVDRYIPAAGAARVAASQQLSEDGTLETVPLAVPLTVRHLLTFTSGIGNRHDPSVLGRLWSEPGLYAGRGSLEERVDRILTLPALRAARREVAIRLVRGRPGSGHRGRGRRAVRQLSRASDLHPAGDVLDGLSASGSRSSEPEPGGDVHAR